MDLVTRLRSLRFRSRKSSASILDKILDESCTDRRRRVYDVVLADGQDPTDFTRHVLVETAFGLLIPIKMDFGEIIKKQVGTGTFVDISYKRSRRSRQPYDGKILKIYPHTKPHSDGKCECEHRSEHEAQNES